MSFPPFVRINSMATFVARRSGPRLMRARRCLVKLTGHQIFGALLLLFAAHLQRHGALRKWRDLAAVAAQADLLYSSAFCLATCCAVCWCSGSAAARGFSCASRAGSASMCALLIALAWFSLVKIAVLHELRLVCILPHLKRFVQRPDIDGPREGLTGLLESPAWIPTGLFSIVGRALARPWLWLYCYGLRLLDDANAGACASSAGAAAPTSWWELREAIVSGTFWLAAALVALAVASTAAPSTCHRRRGSALPLANPSQRSTLCRAARKCALVVYCTFVLTTEPLLWFWCFLLRPLCAICAGLRCTLGGSYESARMAAQSMALEEWISVVLSAWLFARAAYISAEARLERRRARQMAEARVCHAQTHPFKADLEEAFETLREFAACGQQLPLGTSAALGPSLVAEHCAGQAAVRGGCNLGMLQEKRQALMPARRRMLFNEFPGAAALSSHLRLQVRRTSLLEDSLSEVGVRPVAELVARSISVTFEGELGIDAGGLTRDWFDCVAAALVEAGTAPEGLLTMAVDGTLSPSPAPSGEEEPERMRRLCALVALGRFLALAVLHEMPLPISLGSALCKHLLMHPVDLEDVWRLDPDFFRHRVALVLQEGGLAEIEAALQEPLRFVSAPTEVAHQQKELLPGGAQRSVTQENKVQYVSLLCEEHLCGRIRCEIQCILQGFWDVLPLEVLQEHDVCPRELALLISGVGDLEPDEWRLYSRATTDAEVVEWFWDIVRNDLNEQQRCALLHFVTGSSRLPLGGFAKLHPPFSVEVSVAGSPSRLPHAHTCMNRIVMHHYSSKAQLLDRLMLAISAEGFGIV